jgi:hypothetical protein
VDTLMDTLDLDLTRPALKGTRAWFRSQAGERLSPGG